MEAQSAPVFERVLGFYQCGFARIEPVIEPRQQETQGRAARQHGQGVGFRARQRALSGS